MDLSGKIKIINETQTFGERGFRKRELVLTTSEEYPQMILIEFVQDKCDLLDNYTIGQDVNISINLRGREWINPEGVAQYFNSIQGWRIQKAQSTESTPELPTVEEENDDLPF